MRAITYTADKRYFYGVHALHKIKFRLVRTEIYLILLPASVLYSNEGSTFTEMYRQSKSHDYDVGCST